MFGQENISSGTACANCEQPVTGNYCSYCGQKAATHALSWHFVWHDLQHALVHFDKGVPFTLKELFTRPGHSVREFVHGKRVQHFKPISLVILLGGLYGFLFHYFHIELLGGVKLPDGRASEVLEWVFTHFSILELINVPLYSIASFIAFRSYGYNFIEHFVLNCFISAQRIALALAFFPLVYAFNNSKSVVPLILVSFGAGTLMLIWTYRQFFAPITLRAVLFRFQVMVVIIVAEALLLALPIGLLVERYF